MSVSLTALELSVLKALYVSAEGNGGDFGMIEDARSAVDSAKSLGGVVSSLSKKKLINIYDAIRTDSGLWTQFDWAVEVEEIEKLIA